MYLVSAGYPDTYMIPGTYYVPDTYVPGISRLPTRYVCTWYPVSAGSRTFRPWTHTSDDSYMYQLSLVVATATVSYYAVRRIFLVPSIQSHDAGTNHHSRKMTKKKTTSCRVRMLHTTRYKHPCPYSHSAEPVSIQWLRSKEKLRKDGCTEDLVDRTRQPRET